MYFINLSISTSMGILCVHYCEQELVEDGSFDALIKFLLG